MKKRFLFIAFLPLCFWQMNAQDAASVLWSLSATTQQTASLSGQLENASLILSGVNSYNYGGPDATIVISHPGGSWATEEDPNRYVEFSVAPKSGTIFRADEISIYVCGKGGSNMRANFYYSKDASFGQKTQINYRKNEDLTRDSSTGYEQMKVTIDETVEAGEKIYFRIYPYYKSEATGKYICLKDAVISGTTEATEVEASVVWPFISDLKPVISGALLAQDMQYGSNTRQYGWDARVSIDGTKVNNGTFCTNTNDCAWTGTTQPQEDVYVQYAVTAKAGATFTVKNVSLMIAATGTNNMAAAVFASKDETFAVKTQLKAITDLVNEELQLWSMTLETPEEINTGETYYLRVYPFSKADATYKLVGVRNVTISGKLIGATADPAEVSSTTTASYISTTSAISGGNISNDGGAPVTDRGIAYGTTVNPSINDNRQTAGEGTGMFTATLSGLTPHTTYYARAYAINKAGVSYGNEITFKTLEALAPPTVETLNSSSIRNVSMIVSGRITAWGGSDVTERGVVYATTEDPLISGNKVISGRDIGNFQAYIDGLIPQTTYYVRAYAINAVGTAYGQPLRITTKATEPDVTKVVAQDGSGDYTTVQAAFDAAPSDYTGRWIIRIKPGTYYERPTLERSKVNVYLIGEHAETTIITHDTYAGMDNPAGGTWGTSNCQTMAILADDFTAVNLTIANTFINSRANTAINSNTQAVALKTQGDRQSFYNCRITGYQDTYLGNSIGRAYFKNCYIEGNVDFIFGRQTVVFDHCTTYVNRTGSVLTAPSTEKTTLFGMVFLDCDLTAPSTSYVDFNGDSFKEFYYGRPWQQQPKTAIIRCNVPATLNEKGWTTMNGGLNPLFVEYGCTGEGASPERLSKRANEGRVITEEEAAIYTIENVFKKDTDPSFTADWMPKPAPDSDLFTSINSPGKNNENSVQSVCAPNPFEDNCLIHYTLPADTHVKINLYDMRGNRLATLMDKEQAAGNHVFEFDASQLSTGIYFYTIQTDHQIGRYKMIKK
jgi:pectinesterase